MEEGSKKSVSASRAYEVQKILDKKVINGQVSFRLVHRRHFRIILEIGFLQVRYLLKWKNYPNKFNSWTRVANMNCDELLIEFEQRRIVSVLGKFNLC